MSAAHLPFIDYWDAVDARMRDAFGIDTHDAGIDADEIAEAEEAGWDPAEYAEWFGAKHDLKRLPEARR